MTVELLTEAPLAPPAGLGPYRREDYDALPDQPRCELLYGRLYVTPSPTPWHQMVASYLWRHLESLGEAAGGFAYGAPLDTVLADHSVVQPDVIYVSATRLDVLGKRIEGAPDLVVEVVSDSSERKDRRRLPPLYALAGVPELWQVDVRGPRGPYAELGIHHLGPAGYEQAPADAAAWCVSRFLGCRCRLLRRAVHGSRFVYELEVAAQESEQAPEQA